MNLRSGIIHPQKESAIDPKNRRARVLKRGGATRECKQPAPERI